MLHTGTVTVAPNTNQLLFQYIVPANVAMQVPSIIIWGTADVEFSLYKNTDWVAGGRTSASMPTIQLTFGSEIGLQPYYVIQLYGQHPETTDQLISYTVFMEQL